jgi:hypothetical protein
MHVDSSDRNADARKAQPRRRRPMVFLALALLVLGIFGLLLRELLQTTPAPPVAPLAAPDTSKPDHVPLARQPEESRAPAAALAPPEAAARLEPALPALDDSDEEVRATLSDILPLAMQASLAPSDLLRRAATLADNFGNGKILRDKLPLPAVPGKLKIQERDDRVFLDPANHGRYDLLVDALVQIDPRIVARWFDRYEPLLQQAYAELGNPQQPLRERILAGLQLMLNAPEAPAEIELLQPAVFYKYADPSLEALPDSQKLLLRTGPRNRALLLDRVERLHSALERGTAAATDTSP